jgi:hypothetical protein
MAMSTRSAPPQATIRDPFASTPLYRLLRVEVARLNWVALQPLSNGFHVVEGHESPPAEGGWTSTASAGTATDSCAKRSTIASVLYRRARGHRSIRGTIARDRPEALKE